MSDDLTPRRSRRLRGDLPEFDPFTRASPEDEDTDGEFLDCQSSRDTTLQEGSPDLEPDQDSNQPPESLPSILPVEESSRDTTDMPDPAVQDPADSFADARDRYGRALLLVQKSTDSLRHEGETAVDKSATYRTTGIKNDRIRAEIGLQQLKTRFDNFSELIHDAEGLLVECHYNTAEHARIKGELDQHLDTCLDRMIAHRVAIENNLKEGMARHEVSGPASADKLFKIPTLALPTFSGNIKDFPKFRKNFQDLIGKSQLKEYQKLIHLKQALQGPAADIVSNCGEGDDAYQLAWNTLQSRYGDPEVLKPLLLTEIHDVGPIKSGSSLKDQRKMHDKIRGIMVKLLELDVTLGHENSPLIPLIQAKYPIPMRREIEKNRGTRMDIGDFLQEAEKIFKREGKYVATTQRTEKPKGNTASSLYAGTPKGEEPRKDIANQEPAAALVATNQKKGKGKKSKPKPKCLHCPERHYLVECKKFREFTVDKRIQLVKEAQLCEKCLWPKHDKKPCPKKDKPCGHPLKKEGDKCPSKKHHSLLHR